MPEKVLLIFPETIPTRPTGYHQNPGRSRRLFIRGPDYEL